MSQSGSSTVYRVQCTALQQPAACSTAVEGSFILFVDIAAVPPHCSTAATRGSGTQRVTRLLHITRTAALQHVGSCSRLLQCCSELQLQCDTLDTSCPAAAAWSPHMCCSAAVTQPPTDTASGDHHDTWERHFKIILNILLKNMKNRLLFVTPLLVHVRLRIETMKTLNVQFCLISWPTSLVQ